MGEFPPHALENPVVIVVPACGFAAACVLMNIKARYGTGGFTPSIPIQRAEGGLNPGGFGWRSVTRDEPTLDATTGC
jgi:hypothetical protein